MVNNLGKQYKKLSEFLAEQESDPEKKQLLDEARAWVKDNFEEIIEKSSIKEIVFGDIDGTKFCMVYDPEVESILAENISKLYVED